LKKIIYLLLVLLSGDIYSQGRVDGFFKGKGNLDAVFSISQEENKFYFAGREKINFSRETMSYNSFIAYGIVKDLDVNISLPYVDVNGVEKDFQDFSVFLKYKLNHFTIQKIGGDLILAGGFSSNVSDYQVGGGNAIGQQAKAFDLRPVFHFNLGKGFFTTIQSGFTYRLDPVPHSVPFAAKLAYAKAKYYIDIWYDFQYGIGGFDYRGTPAPPSFRELGVSYNKVGGTVYAPIFKYLGAFAGVAYTVSGRNIPHGLGMNVGLVLKYYAKQKDNE